MREHPPKNRITHKIDLPVDEWYATQNGRKVEVRHKHSRRLIRSYAPPVAWGESWAWGVDADARLYFVRG